LRTSADSADAIAPSRAAAGCLRALADLTEATPLEVVARSGLTRETIQPRLSELIALRLIEPTERGAATPLAVARRCCG
jgi:hypothetical protein